MYLEIYLVRQLSSSLSQRKTKIKINVETLQKLTKQNVRNETKAMTILIALL